MSIAHLGRVVRHPHRRDRQHLPAPRGRDRPVRGGDWAVVRRDLDARRVPDGRRQDGQVAGNITRVGDLLADGLSPARCATRSSRSTTGPGSTLRRVACGGRAALPGSTRRSRPSRRIARTGRTTRRSPSCSEGARDGVRATLLTTTSTSRPGWPRLRPRPGVQSAHRARLDIDRRRRPRDRRTARPRPGAGDPAGRRRGSSRTAALLEAGPRRGRPRTSRLGPAARRAGGLADRRGHA